MPPPNPGGMFNDPHAVALRTQCASPPPLPSDLARFVRMSLLPTSVSAGAALTANVTFANAGTARWTGTHILAVAPQPAGGQIWSTARFPLGAASAPVFPTEERSQAFSLQAPSQPGTYDLAFVLRDPVGRVLAASPSAQIAVAPTAPGATFDNAAIVIVNAPGTLQNGQSAPVTVTVTNNGSTTWTTPGYLLRLRSLARISLPQNTVALPGSVAPNASVSLSFTIMCNGQGSSGFVVQMGGPGGAFGQSLGRNVLCQP